MSQLTLEDLRDTRTWLDTIRRNAARTLQYEGMSAYTLLLPPTTVEDQWRQETRCDIFNIILAACPDRHRLDMMSAAEWEATTATVRQVLEDALVAAFNAPLALGEPPAP